METDGRGSVLGDVDAGVVTAAVGWWEPGMVRANRDEGVSVAAPRVAAQRYADTAVRRGDDHLAALPGGLRLVDLARNLGTRVLG